ncbi:FKBP-type peptidyl-prolyl cis-trans isomerase [Silvibacterium dinghuense]|uniref:Peptidyl-prolyl cis-trans isomerase n=1 Tax=Silvibacterium dinghuense TaxID=1560006 RepID=A0A4Q1SKB3_9BACT|nr:FKBP-type peptidyl-prolyl cis-trans isomerase [Silvibacterium dinghuense]
MAQTASPTAPAKASASTTGTAKHSTAHTTTHTATRRTVVHRAAPCPTPKETVPVLPKNIPPVTSDVQTGFALRYQDIQVGTGDEAQPGWYYTVHYTGWLASDGTKFDSSVDRGTPFDFPQGMHRVITGWDEGFAGMKVGGKRRLFIPWQLAYGAQGRGPIPPKADLIFDIELIAQKDPATLQ